MNRRISSIAGVCLLLLVSCRQEKSADHLLEIVPPDVSGITFINKLEDSEDFNIVEYLYYYNGGGVAAGDINNDGLDDLYFSSNRESNRLYLNKGNFRFEDITKTSGTGGTGNWKTGVSMADIDQDGHTDIFVCGVGGYKKFDGRNQVFLNNGDLTFREAAAELGLDFQGLSTQAVFLDADHDGDLDLYLLNHSVHTVRSMGNIDLRLQDDRLSGDKLYENLLVPEGKVRFREVTRSAGILSSALGYGLGIGAADVNEDGVTDLYVSNDFHENDYLYLGDGKGKFNQVAEHTLRHTSRFSMGNEIADLNNDGRPDIITLDMLPWEERIIKASAGEDPYEIFQYKLRLGFHHQYARNTLQLNTGNDKTGIPRFIDIAAHAGIEATDWSWSPLSADFDNDGWTDLFITNGILRRPNDMDYISFISTDSARRTPAFGDFIKRMPEGKVPDRIFRNSGDLTFHNMNGKWIEGAPDLSNGAAYSDLDNDGDLDLVVNTINEPAKVYRNRSDSTRYLQVNLTGPNTNLDAIGSKVLLFSGGKAQYRELQPVRGFQSSSTRRIHFGTASNNADSLIVIWPDGTMFTERNPGINRQLQVHYRTGLPMKGKAWRNRKLMPALFTQLEDGLQHTEDEFTAFSRERLLPHASDAVGPATAAGDLNGDGILDLYVSGGAGKSGQVLLGSTTGSFRATTLASFSADQPDAAAAVVFDANGDKRDDLLLVPGGQEKQASPILYLQKGGALQPCMNCFPSMAINGSCVAAADLDKDGDSDLFIGAAVIPGHYGETPESFILLNDGTGNYKASGKAMFPDQDNRMGMVQAVQAVELNNDGYPDLVMAGEWMGIKVLINQAGKTFRDESAIRGLMNTEGWWHALVAADLDDDGDTDFVAGNHGTNHRLRTSITQPVELVVGDFDKNGSTDQLLTYHNGSQASPFVSRDQLVKQLPVLKKNYLRYAAYQDATPNEVLKKLGNPAAIRKQAVTFQSVVMENNNGNFTLKPLPAPAQFFPVFAVCPVDLNGDNKMDLLLGGNLHQVMTEIGRLDAGNGLVLIGKGGGDFEAVTGPDAGFLIEGECRSITRITLPSGERRVAVGMNNSNLKWFRTVPADRGAGSKQN